MERLGLARDAIELHGVRDAYLEPFTGFASASALRSATVLAARVVPTVRIVEAPLLRTAQGWALDFDAMERAFAAGARAYLLSNPHNPTGRVFTRAELERVAALANRYAVAVIADEIHGLLTLPGAAYTPFASLGEIAARNAVTVTSAPTAWNVAGLKCALVVAGSPEMSRRLSQLPVGLIDRIGHLGVLASISAFRDGLPWLGALLAHLERNRHLLATLLAEHLPAIGYVPPEASYLAWLDCTALGLGLTPPRRSWNEGELHSAAAWTSARTARDLRASTSPPPGRSLRTPCNAWRERSASRFNGIYTSTWGIEEWTGPEIIRPLTKTVLEGLHKVGIWLRTAQFGVDLFFHPEPNHDDERERDPGSA